MNQYKKYEMEIVSFALDEQFVTAIVPGSTTQGDASDPYGIKPEVSDY